MPNDRELLQGLATVRPGLRAQELRKIAMLQATDFSRLALLPKLQTRTGIP